MMMFAVFYNFVMGGFIASLLFDYDERGNVTLITWIQELESQHLLQLRF